MMLSLELPGTLVRITLVWPCTGCPAKSHMGEMLTERLQRGASASAGTGEEQHKVAHGIDVEVRMPRHICAQHKLPDLMRAAIK